MTLPTFLGIGVPRGGTTWFYKLLLSHPDVYVSEKAKEVHFFDCYYERGVKWYEGFFPDEASAVHYQAIGEITPHYLYCRECPARIAAMSSVEKLIVILRNPIDRAYSHYIFRMRVDNYAGTFEDFLSDYPNSIRWGFYSQNLNRYLRWFRREQILILIHENAFADIAETKNNIAHFLGVNQKLFSGALEEKVNRSYMPRFRRAYAILTKIQIYLRERDLYWAINLARKVGVKRVLGVVGDDSVSEMPGEARQYLQNVYSQEITELESLLQIDLVHWR